MAAIVIFTPKCPSEGDISLLECAASVKAPSVTTVTSVTSVTTIKLLFCELTSVSLADLLTEDQTKKHSLGCDSSLAPNTSGRAGGAGQRHRASITNITTPPSASSSPMALPALLISLLMSRPLLWAHYYHCTIINSFDAFTNHFKEVLGSTTAMFSVPNQLLWLRQGTSSTSDYLLQFSTLAATSSWNEASLLSTYRQGLDPHIRAQMVIYDDDTMGMENFMQ